MILPTDPNEGAGAVAPAAPCSPSCSDTPETDQMECGYDAIGVSVTGIASLCREMETERNRLRQWKNEAMQVLGEWESVWESAGSPGHLGQSKALATLKFIQENVEGMARRGEAQN